MIPDGRSGLRIGDAERERATAELGDHYAAGRLTRDELDERLDLAWRARTAADLAPLFVDLPGSGPVAGHEVPARPERSRTSWPGPRSDVPPVRPMPRSGVSLLRVMVLVAIMLALMGLFPPWPLLIVGWFVLARVTGGCRGRARVRRLQT